MVTAQARAADLANTGQVCGDAKVEPVAVIPWKIENQPELIVWHEQVRVTGCGRSSVENLNVGRLGGDPPWRMTFGLPGETLADMTLQGSALPGAIAQARVGLPADCKGQALGDVYIAARPGHVDIPLSRDVTPKAGPGRFGVTLPAGAEAQLSEMDASQAWAEIWPFEICGNDRTIAVIFIPMRGQQKVFHLFLPVWQQIAAHGAGAKPSRAPPD
jgi:hypothetical protein